MLYDFILSVIVLKFKGLIDISGCVFCFGFFVGGCFIEVNVNVIFSLLINMVIGRMICFLLVMG